MPHKLFFVLFTLIFGLLYCRENKIRENAAEVALREQMKKFFTSPGNEGFTGLWLAEQSSLEAAIEKQYLSQYKAQPDEASREVLRQRLKDIKTYLRISNGDVEMLTFSAEGGMGRNSGSLARKGNTATLTLQGKNNSSTVVKLILEKKAEQERLIYKENENTILFFREERSNEQLAAEYFDKMKSLLSLPEY